MTKKDYELLARVFRFAYLYKASDIHTLDVTMAQLMLELGHNPKFDRKKFEKAVETWRTPRF
jgi:hypothetical protein